MASPGLSAAHYGIDILMEMAAEPGPISRTALRSRTALTARQLEAGLNVLTASNLVAHEDGPQGRYLLAEAPEAISIQHLCRALAGASLDSAVRPPAPAFPALADLDPQTTLDGLRRALGAADAELCAYYDACVSLGGPEGPAIHARCNREREEELKGCARK
ncbi:MAG: Rrf2 family transcriptional regulator [Phycisphaerales bacterium]|nr:MAG: Rrf2 family transcriptional regulator [Phycisphaerales bacterium]